MATVRPILKQTYLSVTFSLDANVEGSESHCHIFIVFRLSDTSVASFILTVLDEPADEEKGHDTTRRRPEEAQTRRSHVTHTEPR